MSSVEAVEAIEEANAAIGAAVSTCSMEREYESLLSEVQYELLDLVEVIERGVPAPGPDRLQRAVERYGTGSRTRGFAVLGGASDAAGLLKLARTITRRACRTASPHSPEAGRYLELLGEVLLTVAFRAEEQERTRFEVGCCAGDVVRPTEGMIDSSASTYLR